MLLRLQMKSNKITENVKNCTLISIASASGDFRPPGPLAWPAFGKFLDPLPVNPSVVKSWVRLWF